MIQYFKTHQQVLQHAIFMACIIVGSVSLFAIIQDVFAFSGIGTGEAQDPYQITNCEQLAEINDHLDAYFILNADLSCTTEFLPLARTMIGDELAEEFTGFTGVFDGNGHTIRYAKNIPDGVDTDNYIGLFGYTNGAVIRDLNIVAGWQQGGEGSDELTVGGYSGSLIGKANNTLIINVHVENNIYGLNASSVGGIIGQMTNSRLIGSSFSGAIDTGSQSGGLVGDVYGNYADNSPAIEHSFSTGAIGSLDFGVGNVGGLVGYLAQATIVDSYSQMNVSGYNATGGVVGRSIFSTLTNVYASGNVSVATSGVGGLVGVSSFGTSYTNNSFFAGTVTGASGFGAIVGSIHDDSAEFFVPVNTYWDINSTGLSYCSEFDDIVWPGCSGVITENPTVYWKFSANEPMATWNTSTVWNLGTEANFPELFPYVEPISFASGTGTELDPYIIQTCEQLQAMETDLDAYYRLDGPGGIIDCTATESWNENADEWVDGVVGGSLIPDPYVGVLNNGYFGFNPIGTYEAPFTGTLDGNNNEILNLWIFRKNAEDNGIFAALGGSAYISDITIDNSRIVGGSNTGGIAGFMMGTTTITNVFIDNSMVRAYLSTNGGGIAGHITDNAYISGSEITSSTVHGSGNVIGGIVGYMASGTIMYVATGANVDGGEAIGGAIGAMEGGTVMHVVATGTVESDFSDDAIIDGLSKTGQNVGGFVGRMNAGTISYSRASGDVFTQGSNAGGFAGKLYQNTTISFVTSTGNVTAVYTSSTPNNIGGFVGEMDNWSFDPFILGEPLSNIYVSSTVFAPNSSEVGGFAGTVFARSVVSSTVFGRVEGESNVGGFAGATYCESVFEEVHVAVTVVATGIFGSVGGFSGSDGCEGPGSTFRRVSATGDVVSAGSYVGGLIGSASVSTIEQSYATGDVEGNVYVGGLIGSSSYSTTTESFALGNVIGTGDNIGGLIGQTTGDDSITNVYARGNVTSTDGVQVGGLIGYSNNDTTITNGYVANTSVVGFAAVGAFIGLQNGVATSSFWDSVSTNVETACGGGECLGVTGVATPGMLQQSTFTDAGWDFNDVWGMNGVDNNGYPFFQYQGFTLVDSITLAPSILNPTSETALLTSLDNLTVAFVIPEMYQSDSVRLIFSREDIEGQDPISIRFTNTIVPGEETEFVVDFSEHLSSLAGVAAASTSSIPHGVYTITLLYQDVLANASASDSVESVFIAYLPVLETLAVTDITQTGATFNATVTDGLITGQYGVSVAFGFFVDQTENSYLSSEFIPGPVEPVEYGPFSLVFPGESYPGSQLICGTTYYVQALGVLAGGDFSFENVSISENSVSFTTLSCDEEEEEVRPRRSNGGAISVSRPRITNDTTATTGALRINNGALTTNSRTVELTINATNATQMAISNSLLFSSDVSYVPFTPTVSHTLTEGSGDKTVFVKLRSSDGGVLTISDTILMEPELPPVLPPAIVTQQPTTPIPVNGLQCSTNLVLTTPVRFGAVNNAADVRLLEQFLNTYEGTNLSVNGIYETADFNAVVAWQEKHASDILTPWGLNKGTGYVFTTSLKKIKEIHEKNCATATTVTPTQPTIPVSASCLNTQTTLTSGMNGPLVTTAQTLLKKLNLFTATPTGFYGPVTTASVRAFQTANGIDPVGFIGPATRAKLNELGCR